MDDAAHVGLLEHEIFQKPFKVEPEYEMWDTPGNYRDYPNGVDLPKQMKVWRIGKRVKRVRPFGTVSRSWGYNDSPDAEAIVAGFNHGKEYGAVGVGRHANFLQWGYGEQPSDMTDAGKKLFLNCIVYISKFDGKAPLIRRESSDRYNAVRLAMAKSYIKDKSFFQGVFQAAAAKKYGDDWKEMMKYYQDNLELVYHDRMYIVDRDLVKLGIESNRKVDTLAKLIDMLDDEEKDSVARRLLNRYTRESFKQKEEWDKWFSENKGRIYFTDVGGYKFLVVPKGYLDN